jgi:hypothetical protein
VRAEVKKSSLKERTSAWVSEMIALQIVFPPERLTLSLLELKDQPITIVYLAAVNFSSFMEYPGFHYQLIIPVQSKINLRTKFFSR